MSTQELDLDLNQSNVQPSEQEANWHTLFMVGGVAALLQLIIVIAYIPIATLGAKPVTAQEYFQAFQAGWLSGLLRGDILSTLMIILYLGTLPAMYVALRKHDPSLTVLAGLATLVAVIVCISSDSGLSLLYLSNQYSTAPDAARQAQLLAAGEAAIATDMWHSTGSFITGIFLQGSGVIFSILMLRNKHFSKVTAISGLTANALDLTQHLFHLALPSISATILMVAGPFYLIWFPMLARDFFRLASSAGRK